MTTSGRWNLSVLYERLMLSPTWTSARGVQLCRGERAYRDHYDVAAVLVWLSAKATIQDRLNGTISATKQAHEAFSMVVLALQDEGISGDDFCARGSKDCWESASSVLLSRLGRVLNL